ncbi:hypothetical protein BaRGS_00010697, partial [Batillaria attramentaria]
GLEPRIGLHIFCQPADVSSRDLHRWPSNRVRKLKSVDQARLVATTFDCKYAETSAALNHYVDELLVGIVSQIRLQLSIPFTTIFFPGKEAKRRKEKKALCKGPKGFLTRLFRRGGFGSHGTKKEKAVDNLYEL